MSISVSFDQQLIRNELEHLLDDELPEKAKFFAVSNDTGVGLAGVGQYDGWNCYVYIGAKGKSPPMRKGWELLCDYVFRVCGCERMTSMVDSSNKQAIRMNKLFGMAQEGIIRKANPSTGEDVYVFGFLREDYLNGQQKRKAS